MGIQNGIYGEIGTLDRFICKEQTCPLRFVLFTRCLCGGFDSSTFGLLEFYTAPSVFLPCFSRQLVHHSGPPRVGCQRASFLSPLTVHRIPYTFFSFLHH